MATIDPETNLLSYKDMTTDEMAVKYNEVVDTVDYLREKLEKTKLEMTARDENQFFLEKQFGRSFLELEKKLNMALDQIIVKEDEQSAAELEFNRFMKEFEQTKKELKRTKIELQESQMLVEKKDETIKLRVRIVEDLTSDHRMHSKMIKKHGAVLAARDDTIAFQQNIIASLEAAIVTKNGQIAYQAVDIEKLGDIEEDLIARLTTAEKELKECNYTLSTQSVTIESLLNTLGGKKEDVEILRRTIKDRDVKIKESDGKISGLKARLLQAKQAEKARGMEQHQNKLQRMQIDELVKKRETDHYRLSELVKKREADAHRVRDLVKMHEDDTQRINVMRRTNNARDTTIMGMRRAVEKWEKEKASLEKELSVFRAIEAEVFIDPQDEETEMIFMSEKWMNVEVMTPEKAEEEASDESEEEASDESDMD